jgi:uncharacterized protein YdiU (UPF0061 family)
MKYTPDPAILALPDTLYDPVAPAEFPHLTLRYRNQRAAAEVGLESLTQLEWEQCFARFQPLPGNLQTPLALRYHGHQFRRYNPDLGDGRGFLYAQLRDVSGRLLDLGTKGSGTTPWSRGGDGCLTLKGGVREILAAELLEARGVPTCRIFSLFETGEELWRHDEPSPTRASVLVRLSHSHIRIGSFQRFFVLKDKSSMEQLLQYCIRHFYPDCKGPVDFLKAVTEKLADMTAAWMAAGFVHGVLNTDNVMITGESFDYGPWRFLPHYDPEFTAAYFDEVGLYAYGRQPESVYWALLQLVRSLTLLEKQEVLMPAVSAFEAQYQQAFERRFLERLGVQGEGRALIGAVLEFLAQEPVSWDAFFFDWYGGLCSEARAAVGVRAKCYSGERFGVVLQALEGVEAMDSSELQEEYFQREEPVGLLIEEVERIWKEVEGGNWGELERKVADIRTTEAQRGRGAERAERVERVERVERR